MIDQSTFGNLTALYHTLGCKLNFAETATVAQMLEQRGITRAHRGDSPDIIVVNTCSVTELADKKCRQSIRSLARRHPEAAIVVTGCYAQLKPTDVAALPGVAVVAGNDRKARLAEYIDRWLQTRTAATEVTPGKEIREFVPSCSRGDRTRYFLKVQDGCDCWCTYCTIPKARGRSRSGLTADLASQAQEAAREGGREIVLTGVNIGDFGKHTGETFLQLCHALQQVEGIDRYRISSIEPDLLPDALVEQIASGELSKFMPHFHIPLQSGSDTVLQLMRRRYTTALFASKIATIRRLLPDAFIGVDLIVGSRGETPKLFEQSREFVESLDISRLHVFTYSERPGTRALDIPHVVSQEEKHERTRRMLDVSERKLTAFASRFASTVRPVLIEQSGVGHTDNYLRVEVDGPTRPNTIVNVLLNGILDSNESIKGTLTI